MPLPLPDLDTRTWADLVQEGEALIPRYAPSWTDHNVHDPGITLLELFAWLVEQDIYRVNRIPDRHRLKFLSLIGFAPRAPKPAKTVLAFAPPLGTANLPLSAGFEFAGTDPEGQAVQFRTLRHLTVTVATLDVLQVGQQDADGVTAIVDRTRQWRAGFRSPRWGSIRSRARRCISASATCRRHAGRVAFRSTGLATMTRSDCGSSKRQRRSVSRAVPCCQTSVRTGPFNGAPITSVPPHHSAQIVWEVATGPGPTTDRTGIASPTWLVPSRRRDGRHPLVHARRHRRDGLAGSNGQDQRG